MATSSTKRPADSEQSVESYAVCNTCSRLSRNLGNCDKCGSTLSEDNAAVCYSVDPKRPRLDNSPPSAAVNGTVSQDSSTPPTTSASVAEETTATITATSSNGTTDRSSTPSATTTSTSSSSTTTTASSVACPTPSSSSPTSSTPPTAVSRAAPPYPGTMPSSAVPPAPAASIRPRPPPPLQQQQQAPTPQVSLPSYNLQPAGNSGYKSTPPEPPGLTSQPGPTVTITSDNVLIPAQQIRIGSQKFKPLSPVTFKDDGILFTLKDYTYAPVLLNARAIIRCRANLNFREFPVFFLHLESSCMRQIRNIFGLKDTEFSETFSGQYEIKRCITIFPTIAKSSYSTSQIYQALLRVFGIMEMRYRRFNKIIEEITPEEAIDVLLNPISGRSATSSSSTSSSSSSSAPPTSAPPARVAAAPRTTAPVAATQRSLPQPQQQPQQLHWPPRISGMNRVPPQPPPQPPPAGTGIGRPEGTLTIPRDPVRWEQMQRSLQMGGVYYVQMNDGQKKYCLWNGTQLVPCLVQNTEVRLECSRVRIGSLKASCNGTVRIKLDSNCGIYFNITAPYIGSKQLHISTDDILSASACFDSMARLFIYLKWSGAEKLRTSLKMSRKDPTYDPNASEARRKHLIFSLHDINMDQKDALLQMRLPGQTRALFETLSVLKALKILSDIQKTSSVQSTIDRFLNGKEAAPSHHKMVQIVSKVEEELKRDEQANDVIDDDDDDVIMTEEEVGIKCPYTQQVMKEPIRNKVCGHNYEKIAIQEFMSRKKGVAKCPYAGCGNRAPLKAEDMEENPELKAIIAKLGHNAGT